MARPLIATDVPGNRQLVQNGVNGLLCEARDWASLANALLEMGNKAPMDREEMGRLAREMVEADYSEERVISAYLEAISQLQPLVRV